MSMKYLTVEEAANRLQVTQRTVRNLIKRGHFPGAYKIDPTRRRSHYRIPEKDIAKFEDLRDKST